jgi:hypothetical protein
MHILCLHRRGQRKPLPATVGEPSRLRPRRASACPRGAMLLTKARRRGCMTPSMSIETAPYIEVFGRIRRTSSRHRTTRKARSKSRNLFLAPPQSGQTKFSILTANLHCNRGKIGCKKGSDRMRQEQQPIAAALSAVDFKFGFQLANAGARRACSVTIQAVTVHDAAAIFRANWPTIENLARRSLAENNRSDIRLEAGLAD